MKNSKKIVALVMAMVMIFALTASTLAATNATTGVTVKVTVKGVLNVPTGTNPDNTETTTLCTLQPYQITTGTNKNTVYDLVNSMDAVQSTYAYGPVWKDVPLTDSDGTPTGGYGKALVVLSNKIATSNNATYPDFVYNTWGSTSKTTQTYDGSVFQCYKYVYTGYDWVYSVNGNIIEDKYMDQYVLSDGDQVELIYQYQAKAWERYFSN